MRDKYTRDLLGGAGKPERPRRKKQEESVSKNAVTTKKSLRVKHLHDRSKCRNQSLRQPEAEDQFRSSHQQLRGQTLEETEGALVLKHVGHDPKTRFGVLEIAVLNTGLNHVQRRRHDQGSAGTTH